MFFQARQAVHLRRDHARQGHGKQDLEREGCWRHEVPQVSVAVVCFNAHGMHPPMCGLAGSIVAPISHKACPHYRLRRHKENNRIRVLMRQEKTMKVIANHFLDPRIVLTPNVGNDKSWVWVAFDFSDGELVETVSTFIHSLLNALRII